MGVPGLQSYIEYKSPHGFYHVDVKKLSDDHRKHHAQESSSPSILIIDLQSCVRSVYNGLDLIGGGQFREYSCRWKQVITALTQAGIRPIFVSDGPIPPSKRQTWINRRYSSAKDFVFPILDALKDKKDPQIDSYRSTVLPALETEKILALDIDEEIEVIKSTSDQDADQLIVELAIQHNAFAILAQDTDYLIYQYPKYISYLSSSHFSWESIFNGSTILHTKRYDRYGLARDLGLSVGHFPLLAVLKGNDLVRTEKVDRFHMWIVAQSGSRMTNKNHAVIEGLAMFIKNENLPPGKTIMHNLHSLSEFVFYGEMENHKFLERALQSYFLQPNIPSQSSQKESPWLALMEMQKPGSKLRSVMEGNSNESSTRLEEYRPVISPSEYIPPNAIFLSSFRKRMWGVLLVEKPGVLTKCGNAFAIHIEEWLMSGIGSLDEPKYSKPTVPPRDVYEIGLLAQLWSLRPEKDHHELHQKRWKLFCYIVSDRKMDSQVLQRYSSSQIFVICQLFLFQHEDDINGPILYEWEIKVLILLHFAIKQYFGKL